MTPRQWRRDESTRSNGLSWTQIGRAAVLALAGVGLATPAHADFFDDVRHTFQKDIPRTFEEDIPRAFGAEPKKSPKPPNRNNATKPPPAEQRR